MFAMVNYDMVLESQEMCDLLKSAVTRIQSNPYCTLSRFLQGFRDHELEQFMVEIGDPENPNLKQPIILTMIMAAAEGVDLENEGQFAIAVDYTIFVTVSESLRRKGLVKINYSQISFDNAFIEEHYQRGITPIRPSEEGIDSSDYD